MNFIPETPRHAVDVPFFENASGANGWQGQTSRKSIDALKGEVSEALARLGGIVVSVMPGKFQTAGRGRYGFRITYLANEMRGQIDLAALPMKSETPAKKLQTQRMALFMFRTALEGAWFMQQLSPGYAPLMPFMLTESGKTITELWSEGAAMRNLLPAGTDEFIEGDFREV